MSFAAQSETDWPVSVFVETLNLGGDGMRVAIKDVVDVAGSQTRLGSRAYEEAPLAKSHAEIVDRILGAGHQIVGKTLMHELAYGVTGLNDYAGTPINPNFRALIPGGSSSGSAAAVAAGLCDWSVGTDTGGSIRVPAACCGVFGIKPTFGRVSRSGFLPANSSLDCAGPFARDAKTLNAAMSVLAADWKALPETSDLRLGFVSVGAEPGLWTAAYEVASRLGGNVRDLTLSDFTPAHKAGLTIIASETYAAFGHLLAEGKVGSDVFNRLSKARDISQAELADAERTRRSFANEVDAALEQVDLLALPTLPIFPPRVCEAGDLMKFVRITELCRPFNLSGHPAISIPLAPVDGKPSSLQLVAKKGEDERLISAAVALGALAATSPNQS